MGLAKRIEFDATTRRDFNIFAERVFAELNPATPYLDNFHIGIIAEHLEKVRRGEITRLIINVPPRSLKSLLASVAFPAFVLGHDPTKKIICASYGQELADDLARDCRQVMQQPWYRSLFPRAHLAPSRQAVHAFETTVGGYRLATSVGGVLTGFGADVIVIDDPIKPDEALSEVERNRANQWFSHTLITRLKDKAEGAIVVVMQRLHEDDFVGHILELDDWEVVSFSAIAQEDEVHTVTTPFGAYTHHRAEGGALHPAREPIGLLEAMRRRLGSEHFAAQYLQSPVPPGGGRIKGAWFPRYEVAPAPLERIIQSWDTASKAKEMADFSVCTTWGVKDKHYYLLNVLRRRLEFPELKAAVIAQARLYPSPVILIEDKGSGTALVQELRRENIAVTPYEPKGDKIFRMEGQTALIENGFVHIPREAHWLEEFLHEVMMFPKGRHDDQIDSMSQALDWARRGGAHGWFEYYKGLYEESQRSRAPRNEPRSAGGEAVAPVRLRAPPHTSSFEMSNGRVYQVDSERLVLANPDDVQILLGAGCVRLEDP